jgi:type VI secretion system protein ImpH
VRSASALQRVLAALFEFPVEIEELQGRWIDMAPSEQTRLDSDGQFAFSQLGVNAVAGASVWDVQSRFRVRLGPMGLEDFRTFFSPDGPRKAMDQAIRLAVGAAMDYDLQLVLRRAEVPALALGSEGQPAYLGQTTWVITRTPDRDVEDAILPSGPGPRSKHAQAAPELAVV